MIIHPPNGLQVQQFQNGFDLQSNAVDLSLLLNGGTPSVDGSRREPRTGCDLLMVRGWNQEHDAIRCADHRSTRCRRCSYARYPTNIARDALS